MKKLLFIFFLGALISCEDNTNSIESIDASNENSSELNYSKPTGFSINNPDNPYDIVGQLHNDVLNEHLTNTQGNNLDIEDVKISVKGICLDNQSYLNLLGEDDIIELDSEIIDKALLDYENNFSNIIEDDITLGKQGTNELKKLLNYVMNFNGSYYDYYGDLFVFEENILKNKELSSEDKAVILMSSSTARYSFDLWFERQVKSVNIDYNTPVTYGRKEGGGFLNVIIIVGADVIGGAIGAATAGSATFGTGAAAGAVVVGGTASGIAAAVVLP